MLTITTEKHTLYINIELLKKRLKNAVITLLTISAFIFAFVGILIIIGTEGASKITDKTIYQIFINCFKGFFLCGVAWVLNFIKLVIE